MLCFGTKGTESRPNSEADTHHRPKPRALDMCSCLFIEMNQTAHISLQILSISNSVETKSTGSAISLLAQPASCISVFFAFLPSGASPFWLVRRSVWRSVVRLSAAGERGFTVRRPNPQALFSAYRHIFYVNCYYLIKSNGYTCHFFDFHRFGLQSPSRICVRCYQILRYPQTYPQPRRKSGGNPTPSQRFTRWNRIRESEE